MNCCKNCGSKTVKTIDLVDETMNVCLVCGYGRPSLRDPMQYDAAYESKYLAYPEDSINRIRLNFIKLCETVETKSILDYGCGSGSFVKAARLTGYEAYGFDVNDYTADLRPPAGFSPDTITAWDSFEHLTDEQQTELFGIAKNAKRIILSVPDFAAPDKNKIRQWRHYRPREHLHYYTSAALSIRFLKKGFETVFISHAEDAVRKAPWKNNILTVGFARYE